MYNGPVDVGPDGFLRFGTDRKTALRLRSRLDENAATLTLTWNDYREQEDAGTEKDLDLVVTDAGGKVVGADGAAVPLGEAGARLPEVR